MSDTTSYRSSYTGQQVEDAIGKALPLEDFSYVDDKTIDGKSFHILWKVKPNSTNTVSGISVHPDTGQLCEVVSTAGSLTVKPYASSTLTVKVEDETLILN
jgi:hypothetical protein